MLNIQIKYPAMAINLFGILLIIIFGILAPFILFNFVFIFLVMIIKFKFKNTSIEISEKKLNPISKIICQKGKVLSVLFLLGMILFGLNVVFFVNQTQSVTNIYLTDSGNAVFYSYEGYEYFVDLAFSYSNYFNALIFSNFEFLIDDYLFDTILVIAHGGDIIVDKGAYLENNGVWYYFTEFNANRVIFVSCNSYFMQISDTDTNYYGYANQTQLDDLYVVVTNPNGSLITMYGYATYLLEYLQNGYSWEDADIIARQLTDKNVYPISKGDN